MRAPETDIERENPALMANVRIWWSTFPEHERFEFEMACLERGEHSLMWLLLAVASRAQMHPMNVFASRREEAKH